MVMKRTSAVAAIIQAVSPVSMDGAASWAKEVAVDTTKAKEPASRPLKRGLFMARK